MIPRFATDVLGAAAAIAAGTQAYAQAVRFDNSGLQFEWPNRWLDVTLAPEEQMSYSEGSSGYQYWGASWVCEWYDCGVLALARVEGDLLLANEWDGGDYSGNYVRSYPAGTLVADGLFANSFDNPLLADAYYCHMCFPFQGFCCQDDQFAAARFEIDGKTHYGWVQLRQGYRYSAEALAWGYEKQPDTPILVGEGQTPEFCQVQAFHAPGAMPGDGYGQAVSADTGRATIGAFEADGAGDASGAVFFQRRVNDTWNVQRLSNPPGLAAGDFFGASVDIEGIWVIAGAPRSDLAETNAGAAYIYRDFGDNVVFDAALLDPDAAANDRFGTSVSLGFSVAAVGSPRDDTADGVDAGSVSLFVPSGGTWQQVIRLESPQGHEGDMFGQSVAAWGDLVDEGGEATFVIGAPGDDDAGLDAGALYVFRFYSGNWRTPEKIVPASLNAGDRFGTSVSTDRVRALVGVPGSDVSAPDAGAALMILLASGTVEATLYSPNPHPGDAFGAAVSVAGIGALVGAPLSDAYGGDSGAAYYYVRSPAGWNLRTTLCGATVDEGDIFGQSVAFGTGALLVGAVFDEGPAGEKQGSVQEFRTEGCAPRCDADLDQSTGPGVLDLFDFLAFVNFFNAGRPGADCLPDGSLDLFDFLCFNNAFNTGCP